MCLKTRMASLSLSCLHLILAKTRKLHSSSSVVPFLVFMVHLTIILRLHFYSFFPYILIVLLTRCTFMCDQSQPCFTQTIIYLTLTEKIKLSFLTDFFHIYWQVVTAYTSFPKGKVVVVSRESKECTGHKGYLWGSQTHTHTHSL